MVVSESTFLDFAAAILAVPPESITLDTAYHSISAWDSIAQFRLVMELEARFGVQIPIEAIPGLLTLRDFYVRVPKRPAKVLALDADGTLWRGIVSEDGPEAITPYADFQRGILNLKKQGVILVLLSKNDPPDTPSAPIARAFARADNPLKLSDFADIRVNWTPKPGNLLQAAQRVNVASESFVFVDDNPFERAQMRAHLPGVMVPEVPTDFAASADFLKMLAETYFASSGQTAEDRLRANFKPLAATTPDYLRTLELHLAPARATTTDIPRLAQMAAKTNQFNFTTLRRSAEDFAALLASPEKRVWLFRASDKFGEMGIVCYLVWDMPTGRITDFVMSCRAMGRTLEHFAVNYVRHEIAKVGGKLAGFDFTPSAKNAPAAEFHALLQKGEPLVTYFNL